MSFRTIATIAKCSHGSVSAQKKEWMAKKAALKLHEADQDMQDAPTSTNPVPPLSPIQPSKAGQEAESTANPSSDTVTP